MKNKYLKKLLLIFACCPFFTGAQTLSPYLGVGHNSTIKKVFFAKKGTLLISTDYNGKVIVWDFFGRKEINSFSLKSSPNITIVKDSILYCSNDKSFKSLPELNTIANNNFDTSVTKTSAYSFSISKNGNNLNCLNNGKTFRVIPRINNDFSDFSLNANSSYLAHVCGDAYVIVRPISDLGKMNAIEVGSNTSAIAFHPELSNLIVSGTEEGGLKIVDIKSGKEIYTLTSELLKPTTIYDDLYKQNVVINQSNNSYVFNYKNLLLSQFSLPFSKIKVDENFYHLYNDSAKKSTIFFWKRNYNLYKYSDDSLYKYDHFKTAKFIDKYYRVESKLLATVLSRPTDLLFIIGHINEIQLPSQNVILNASNANTVSYNINGNVFTNDETSKKKFRSVGYGQIFYTEDDSTLLTYRLPYYLNVFDKQDKVKPCNYYMPDLTGIYTVKNSYFIAQFKSKLLPLDYKNNELKKKDSLNGKYINSSADGDEFYYKDENNKLFVYNIENDKQILSFNTKTDRSVLFVKKVVQQNSLKGYLLFYDIGIVEYKKISDELIGTFYCYRNGEFIFMLPDNNFYASNKSLISKVILKSNKESFLLDQLEAKYNRPDIVMQNLLYIDSSKIDLYKNAYLKYSRYVQKNTTTKLGKLPEIKIQNWNSNYYTTDSTLIIHLISNSFDSKIFKLNIYINGVPLYGRAGLNLSNRNLNYLDTLITIRLSAGDNLIKPVCISQEGGKSFINTYYIKSDYNSKQKVYFLGIGAGSFKSSNYNLKYAEKDIKDIATTLKNRYGSALVLDTLFSDNVTKENVLNKIASYSKLGINDKLIISYSGHGMLDNENNYFLSTYNIDFNYPTNNGLSYDAIEKAIEQLPSRYKVLFLDACNSGEIDKDNFFQEKSGPTGTKGISLNKKNNSTSDNSFYTMQDVFSDFSQPSGTIVISASRGNQFALEGKQWNNGAFTYAIIQGLQNNKADINKDGIVSISELKNYVGKKVSEITLGKQKPTSRKDLLDYDWSL